VFLDWFGPLVEATADLPSAPFTVLGDSFTALALSADGTLLAAADFESADLNIWDLQSGEMLLDIEVGPMGAGNGLHFSRDGTRLLTAGDGVYAYLLDTHSGEVLLRFGLDRDGVVTDARFSPDEQIVATSGRDVRLWDANSGDLLQTFAPSDMAQSVRFNAAGTQLLTASGSRAYIWDIESGEHVVVFEGHQDYVERAIFSPDETQIATIGWDRIRIWDVATGDELARCTGGEEEEKFTLAYSPDGVYLASGSFLTLRLLDAATCEQITALERDDTRDMVFSPDGLRLIVSGYSGITTYYVADLLETTDE